MSPSVNPNHHLWRNGRFWWTAFTVIFDGWRQERIRESLETTDVELARARRDGRLAYFRTLPNCEVSLRVRLCRPAASGYEAFTFAPGQASQSAADAGPGAGR